MKKLILFIFVVIPLFATSQTPQRFTKVIVTGDITSPKFIKTGSTVDSVLLGNGTARSVNSIKTDTTHLSARINTKQPLGVYSTDIHGNITALNAVSGTNTGDETQATIKTKLGITTLTGNNTGDQTTITGNSGSASKLQTARTINGVSFDGTQNITVNATDATSRVASSLLGTANGVATLDGNGLILTTQLPGYVDDVLEFTNLASFPITGETGKIYVAKDTNKIYRWSGSTYIYITSGSVDSVNGYTGIITLAKSDVGLGNVDNTSDLNKPISTATQTALNGKQAIGTYSTDIHGNITALNAVTGTNTGDETLTTIKTKLGITTLSGSNTGDQTTITGNAGSATKLQAAKTINGVSFDGTQNITINATDATSRVASSLLGAANGVATLDNNGIILTTQLPSYVDDVLEYANLVSFPSVGETGKIYVAKDTNKTYRWSGSVYIYITSGAVDSVNGYTGVISLAKSDIGLGNVDNTSDLNKPISTATQSALNVKQASGTYSTDIHSNIIALNAVTGTNTGDETLTSIKTKLGAANTANTGYLTSSDWNTFNNKLSSIGYGNVIGALGYTPYNSTNPLGFITQEQTFQQYIGSPTNRLGGLYGTTADFSGTPTINGVSLDSKYQASSTAINTGNIGSQSVSYASNSGQFNGVNFNGLLNRIGGVSENVNTTYSLSGTNVWVNSTVGRPTAYGVLLNISDIGQNWNNQLGFSTDNDIYFRQAINNLDYTGISWNRIFHSGNSNLPTVDWTARNLTASGNIIASGLSATNLSTGYIPMKSSGILVNSPLDVNGGIVTISSGNQTTARFSINNYGGGQKYSLVAGIKDISQDGFSIYSESNNSTLFTISGYGNVGIGYSSGTEITNNKLAVNGGVYANSFKIPTGTSSQFLKADGSVDENNYIPNNASIDTHNIFIGNSAGLGATSSNQSNFIGTYAGYLASETDFSNLIGFQAGSAISGNQIGENNIIIGTNISLPSATTNAINIGGVLFGTGTYSTITGNPSTTPVAVGKIGIGVVDPTATLDVNGDVNFNGQTWSIGDIYTEGTLRAFQGVAVGHSEPSLTDGGQILYDDVNNKLKVYGNYGWERIQSSTTTTPPTSSTSAGHTGDVVYDSNYIYVCVSTNTWKRSALSTW